MLLKAYLGTCFANWLRLYKCSSIRLFLKLYAIPYINKNIIFKVNHSPLIAFFIYKTKYWMGVNESNSTCGLSGHWKLAETWMKCYFLSQPTGRTSYLVIIALKLNKNCFNLGYDLLPKELTVDFWCCLYIRWVEISYHPGFLTWQPVLRPPYRNNSVQLRPSHHSRSPRLMDGSIIHFGLSCPVLSYDGAQLPVLRLVPKIDGALKLIISVPESNRFIWQSIWCV